jgi:hypothetical protein
MKVGELLLLRRFERLLAARLSETLVATEQVPESWSRFPISWLCFGERIGCVREAGPLWTGEDVMSDIIRLFMSFYEPIVDTVAVAVGIDRGDKRAMSVYVQPDYSVQSTVVIVQPRIGNLVHITEMVAWHLAFAVPEAMEAELQSEYTSILAHVK